MEMIILFTNVSTLSDKDLGKMLTVDDLFRDSSLDQT